MYTKFTPSEINMLSWSFDYIREHPGTTTDRLPDIWVKFWSVPDFINNVRYEADCEQVLVFMFILRLCEKFDVDKEDMLNSFYFNRLFYDFQILLIAVDYCRNHHIEVPAFPIFDIRKYAVPHLEDSNQLMKQYRRIVGDLTK